MSVEVQRRALLLRSRTDRQDSAAHCVSPLRTQYATGLQGKVDVQSAGEFQFSKTESPVIPSLRRCTGSVCFAIRLPATGDASRQHSTRDTTCRSATETPISEKITTAPRPVRNVHELFTRIGPAHDARNRNSKRLKGSKAGPNDAEIRTVKATLLHHLFMTHFRVEFRRPVTGTVLNTQLSGREVVVPAV